MRSAAHRLLALAAVAALFGVAGCGDEEGTTTAAPTTTSTTSSSTTPTTSTTSSSTTSTTTQPTETTTSSTVTETTGATTTTPDYDPAKPDSETNDKPPKAGSPEKAFEEACQNDPSLCG